MKKILFIIYTHSLGGGAERILTNVVNGLAKKTDYEISVLEYAKYDIKEEIIDERIKRLKPVVDMKNSTRPERIIKFFMVHLCPCILRKFFIKEKYDVEISFNCQIPSFLTSPKKSVLNIQWNHGDLYGLRNKRFKRFLQSRSFKKADKIVAISENTKNSILEVFPKYAKKVNIVHNGTDVEAIIEGSKQHTDIELPKNSLVFLGRLEPNKNPIKLVGYMEQLVKDGIDINLYMLGTGVQNDEVAQYIKSANLEEKVKLLGYINNPYPIIKQGAAVCLLSNSEGFPTVFTEGMALGKPFISSNIGGVAELSNNGNCGVIISNYEEFKQAVLSVVLDTENHERMSKACMEHIKLFSYEEQINEAIRLIEQK